MNAVFSFSNTTLAVIRNIKDTAGRPIFLDFLDGAASGFAGSLFGYPCKLNQYAPSVATGNAPILFGDHSKGYLLREVTPGVIIKQSAVRWIELNRNGVVGFARCGGAPTLANTTTYSPLQALKID
jgi:HK97 family phage major capsid protein